MFLKSIAAVSLLAASTLANAATFNLVSNGGFETGTLANWSVNAVGNPSGGCPFAGRNWNVSNSGGATGCSAVGNPSEGQYAAYVMNDGLAESTYTLSQDFLVPFNVTSASLAWSDSSVSSYNGALRSLSVGLYAGNTLLADVYQFNMPLSDFSSAWDARQVDVSALLAAHGGQTLTVRFSNYIPNTWTGPAGLALDNISLTAEAANVPEPGSMALLGLGLMAGALVRRRKA